MFQNEAVDESFSLDELVDINGSGLWDGIKDKAVDAGEWIEGKLGVSDCINELRMITAIILLTRHIDVWQIYRGNELTGCAVSFTLLRVGFLLQTVS